MSLHIRIDLEKLEKAPLYQRIESIASSFIEFLVKHAYHCATYPPDPGIFDRQPESVLEHGLKDIFKRKKMLASMAHYHHCIFLTTETSLPIRSFTSWPSWVKTAPLWAAIVSCRSWITTNTHCGIWNRKRE